MPLLGTPMATTLLPWIGIVGGAMAWVARARCCPALCCPSINLPRRTISSSWGWAMVDGVRGMQAGLILTTQ